MKSFNKFILSAAAAMVLLTGSARADTFSFSYQFSDSNFSPGKFEGTLTGTQVGDSFTGYVTDITVLSLFVTSYDPVDGSILFDSAPISAPLFNFSMDSVTGEVNGYNSAEVYFDQDMNNFIFTKDDFLSPGFDINSATGYVYLLNGSINSGGYIFLDALGFEAPFDNGMGDWELINLDSPVTVPDGGVSVGMFGLALLCLAAIRRRQSAC